jgi:peptide/nickel transport system permease protein
LIYRTLINRLVQLVVVMILVTFATTALVNLIPGTPADLVLGGNPSVAAIKHFNHQYGYDRPILVQYWHWVVNALQGNLGVSIQSNTSVTSLIIKALPVSVEIAVLGFVLSLVIAVALALVAVIHPGGVLDRVIGAFSALFYSVPVYVSAVAFVYLLAVKTRLFPPVGWVPLSTSITGNLRHVALPVITLTVVLAALPLRVLRGDLSVVLNEDYVTSARARGIPEWYVLLRYAFRPASLSLLTIEGIVFGYLFAGNIIIETFYGTPGVGYLVSFAQAGKDIPIIQGVVVFVALVFMTVNLLVDLCYPLLDPRLRGSVAQRRG